MKTFMKITIYTIGAIALSVLNGKLMSKLNNEIENVLGKD